MPQSAQMPDLAPTTANQSVSHPIDMDHLLHYTMGDEKLAQEVLGLFSAQGRLYLEQLASNATEDEKKIAAHSLKGSAQGVGAQVVAAKALVLETLTGSADKSSWNHALNELEDAFAAAAGFIDEQS